MTSERQKVSTTTVRRLSLYLRHLDDFAAQGRSTVSSAELSRRVGTTSAQVRKDLSVFGSFGKRGLGYSVEDLSDELRRILGLSRKWRVALVGAGRIGSALFEYRDFRRQGFHIVSILDADPGKIGSRWGDVEIRDTTELERVIRDAEIDIVIVAVPAEAAQEIVDRSVDAGIRGILNFAPTQVRVPEGIIVNDVNMAVELETLSFALSRGRVA